MEISMTNRREVEILLGAGRTKSAERGQWVAQVLSQISVGSAIAAATNSALQMYQYKSESQLLL